MNKVSTELNTRRQRAAGSRAAEGKPDAAFALVAFPCAPSFMSTASTFVRMPEKRPDLKWLDISKFAANFSGQRGLDSIWSYHHNAGMPSPRPVKPCFFVGTGRRDLVACPERVRADIGHALHEVQRGGEPVSAKALKGFGGRSVLEVVDDFDGDTFRAVYTVRFATAVYVLHVFKKKSTKGAATPKRDIDLVLSRLKEAEQHYRLSIAAGEKSR